MTRDLTRLSTALLLALGLLLTGTACNTDQTGDSVTENQGDEVPGSDRDKAEETTAP